MKMTIITQEGVLVNYDNVVSIAPALWDAEDIETKESVPVFTLSAKIVQQEEEIQLGIFETEEELDKACWCRKCRYCNANGNASWLYRSTDVYNAAYWSDFKIRI
ncbi:MAG: hypothetical protein IJX77_01770 [Ruminococcus sp.]|nr:hypothetical protein [Ruminococcus sp.]